MNMIFVIPILLKKKVSYLSFTEGNLIHLHSGFTLIEIMISMALSLILMTALSVFYMNVSRNNQNIDSATWQMGDAQFALQLLKRDIEHAGYWASYIPTFDDLTYELVPSDVPTAVPNPCISYDTTWTTWTAAVITNLLGIPVQAYGAVPTECTITNRKDGTDVLIVRHANTCLVGETDCGVYDNTKLYFQSSLNFAGYCPPPKTDSDRDLRAFVLSRGIDASPPGGVLDTLHEKDCETEITEKRKFISNRYWIRNYEVTEGDGIPTLMRTEFGMDSQALIGGIEGFRVELGIDRRSKSNALNNYGATIAWHNVAIKDYPTNRGDGIPDDSNGDNTLDDPFVHCSGSAGCDLNQLLNVVAVKLYLLVRDREITSGYIDTKTYTLGSTTLGPYNDGFKRHIYNTNIRLINIAARRETP